MYSKNEVRKFVFGPLAFSVRNWQGVFFMSEDLKSRISAMPVADAEAANRAAWKVQRSCTRIANRSCNMSRAGNSDVYFAAAAEAAIAEAVAKQTYRRMRAA